MSKKIAIICAVSLNGVYGIKNKLSGKEEIPWKSSYDLSRFKEVTKGKTVVMGRGTWDSLPIKPLPDRENIVVSSNGRLKLPDGVRLVGNIDEAIEKATTEKVFIIGGARLWASVLPIANYIYLTIVHKDILVTDRTFVFKQALTVAKLYPNYHLIRDFFIEEDIGDGKDTKVEFFEYERRFKK